MFCSLIIVVLLGLVVTGEGVNSGRSVYGPLVGSPRGSASRSNVIDPRVNQLKDSVRQQYKQARARESSSSYVQSRRFHQDPSVRSPGLSYSYQSPFSAGSYYSGSYAIGSSFAGSSQEGCRLTNNYCARDYQCCSGKCRCVRWSVMGKMSCYKKCF